MIFKAAIVGAGKIGAFFDAPDSETVLTHAHAYKSHPNFELVGFVDEDYELARKAGEIWGVEAYESLDRLFEQEEIKVISLCSSTNSHYAVLNELQNYPQILGGIIEKPLASSLNEALLIRDSSFYQQRNFLVNYKRRFLPEFQIIKGKIEKGNYGSLVSGTIYYGNGLHNNATHALDLLRFFGYEIKSVISSSKKDSSPNIDYEAILEINSGTLHLCPIPASLYKIFEIDLFFEHARVRIQDEGFPIIEYAIKEDTLFKGYHVPVQGETFNSNADHVMTYVLENLVHSLVSNTQVLCTIEDGYAVQKLCNDIELS